MEDELGGPKWRGLRFHTVSWKYICLPVLHIPPAENWSAYEFHAFYMLETYLLTCSTHPTDWQHTGCFIRTVLKFALMAAWQPPLMDSKIHSKVHWVHCILRHCLHKYLIIFQILIKWILTNHYWACWIWTLYTL